MSSIHRLYHDMQDTLLCRLCHIWYRRKAYASHHQVCAHDSLLLKFGSLPLCCSRTVLKLCSKHMLCKLQLNAGKHALDAYFLSWWC